MRRVSRFVGRREVDAEILLIPETLGLALQPRRVGTVHPRVHDVDRFADLEQRAPGGITRPVFRRHDGSVPGRWAQVTDDRRPRVGCEPRTDRELSAVGSRHPGGVDSFPEIHVAGEIESGDLFAVRSSQ